MPKAFLISFLVLLGAITAYRFATWELIGVGHSNIVGTTVPTDSLIPSRCSAAVNLVKHLQEDLFENRSCSNPGITMLRLAYHDAMGFSTSGGKGGGADGSILVFPEESAYIANGWIKPTRDALVNSTSDFVNGISAGDLLFLAAAVGISSCPGVPRPKIFLGRPKPTAPAVDGTVPLATDSSTAILSRFRDVGLTPSDLVALISAHSLVVSYGGYKPNGTFQLGAPLDSTPKVFDTQYFLETMLKPQSSVGAILSPTIMLSAMDGEPRLKSDWALSQDSQTSCAWSNMINKQAVMQAKFVAAFEKLSLVGQDPAVLTDCSALLTLVPPSVNVTAATMYPPGFSAADFVGECPAPVLATAPGPKIFVPPLICDHCTTLDWRGLPN